MIDHTHLGKGAIPDVPDARDFDATEHIMAVAPADFNQGFMNPEPPNEDQNGSGSCVGQGWSYQHWAIRPKNYCRRDVYAWIFIPPSGGAQIRDGGLRIINFGQDTRDNVQDPSPETEVGMEDRTSLDPNREKVNREFDSKLVPKDIDSIAVAIREWKGVVFGVTGTNEGWQNIANPRPPASGETTWGHCLYLFGFHMHDGLKCVIAKSSWGNVGNTTVHHIKEDYFATGFIFNPWTLIPKGTETMNLVNDNGTIFVVGELGKIGIADPDALAKFQKVTAQVQIGSTANVPQVGVFKSITPPIASALVDN